MFKLFDKQEQVLITFIVFSSISKKSPSYIHSMDDSVFSAQRSGVAAVLSYIEGTRQ